MGGPGLYCHFVSVTGCHIRDCLFEDEPPIYPVAHTERESSRLFRYHRTIACVAHAASKSKVSGTRLNIYGKSNPLRSERRH